MKQPSPKDKQQFQLAMQELNSGDPEKAIRLFSKVRKSWCENADILYLEGMAYGKLGKTKDVERVARRALALQANHFGALNLLANTQMISGEKEAALKNYEKALTIQPDAHEVLDDYGRALSMLGRREEAIEHYKKVLNKHRNFVPSYCALAKAYCEAGDPRSGLDYFKQALQLDQNNYEAHLGLGQAYCGFGGLPMAELHYNKARQRISNNKEPYIGLANVERYRGNYNRMLVYIGLAEQYTEKNDYQLLCMRAVACERTGQYEKAGNLLERLSNDDKNKPLAAATFSKICRYINKSDDGIERIQACLDSTETDVSDNKNLMYSAGDLYDKLQQYDKAFEFYTKANNAGVKVSSDREFYKSFYDDLIKGFGESEYHKLARSESQTTRPIFILGMPRSGTSLIEQILSKHPEVYAAGELSYINDLSLELAGENNVFYGSKVQQADEKRLTRLSNAYLEKLSCHDNSARFVTDKMPNNFQHIGLISILFPHAKIIHCKRNPLDNGLSIYFQPFLWVHDYATDLADIGDYYKEYERLMKHWESVVDIPMLNVQYEDVVDDQEKATQKILKFCGLEWDNSVMDFHESDREVATASYGQVRQPIYRTSKERWRNYSNYVKPLYDELSHSVQDTLDFNE